jgi:glutamate racemase
MHNIGVFDSGVGGLTVVREILEQYPGQQVTYFGDTLHVPYGSRAVDELIGFSECISNFLLNQGAQLIIVACNTSASVSMGHLRSSFSVPIVGVVHPGARTAAKLTRNKKIGVIATEGTIKSHSHAKYLQILDPEIQVFGEACPLFVPLVEAGLADSPKAKDVAATYLKPLKEQGIDTLILGCTHYPYLSSVIQEIMGPEVTLVDPARETVREAGEILRIIPPLEEVVPALSKSIGTPEHSFFVSGDPELFQNVGSPFLSGRITEVTKAELDWRQENPWTTNQR